MINFWNNCLKGTKKAVAKMSKLDDLIKQFCPNGVEFVPLWSITAWDKKFNEVDKKKQSKIMKYHYLLADNLKSLQVANGDIKLLTTNTSNLWTTVELAGNKVSNGEIVCIPWGGIPNVQYYKGKFLTADNRIATSLDINILSNKFLYYFMLNAIDEIQTYYRGAGLQHPSMKNILDMIIPLPPLPVQNEIVRILDKFTKLETELETELETRKKQYVYYRNNLLDFGKPSNIILTSNEQRARWLTMSEVCEIRGGFTPSKANKAFWTDGTIPWFRMEDIRENGRILKDSIQHINENAIKGKGLFAPNSIIIATTATIGEHAMLIAGSLANQRFTNLEIRKSLSKEILPKFFFYYCYKVCEWCKANTHISGFASVDMVGFKKLFIPIPPIVEQERIVALLDKFDALTTDLTNGLPAEIDARKKQYEYYRNKLLTFKKLA
jgi:type I restriction enzyme S subunit